jgi:Dolichol-phosphate mannosyltransferase subunit 3 (DPM3)
MLCDIKLVCTLHDKCASCHCPFHAPSTAVYIVQAPFAAVVAFGLYSIAAVLYGVFTFRDCPEEAASLHKVATSLSPAH